MAQLSEVIEGIQILAKYSKKGEKSHDISADYDVIYAGPSFETDTEIGPEEREKLIKLGWHFEEEMNSWARFC